MVSPMNKHTPYPTENQPRKLGRLAGGLFYSVKPNSWILKEIDGDTDYGLDYLVQYSDSNGGVKYNFFD